MKRKTTPKILILVFFVALIAAMFPYIRCFLFSAQSNHTITKFQNTVGRTVILPETPTESVDQTEQDTSDVQENDTTDVHQTVFPELYSQLQAYNELLWYNQENELIDTFRYEEPAVDVQPYLEVDNIGYISIPAMEVELPLYLGATEQNMAKGAVVMGNTSCPIGGLATNCGIAGHRGYRGIPYFREIERLKAGDQVIITNPWETLYYQVTHWEITGPSERLKLYPDKDMITLVTCHPYRVGTMRYLVYCERIDDPTVSDDVPEVETEEIPTQAPLPEGTPIIRYFIPSAQESSESQIEIESIVQVLGVIFVILSGTSLVIYTFLSRRKD